MRIDAGTILGIMLAAGGIWWGLVLEGGSLREILQPTAALIVFGGTFGATLISVPFPTVLGACRQAGVIFSQPKHDLDAKTEQIVLLANKARRAGIVSLEKQLKEISDPFLGKAITLAVDGTEPSDIRHIMEKEIDQEFGRREAEARVFETAGGYAPTIGIIGAVMGLIQVMKHLEDIDEVAKGIAVAFVATIYGVGVANLVLLPGAKKIISRAQEAATLKELTLEGVIALSEGLNPRLIRNKLSAFLEEKDEAPSEASGDPSPAAAGR